MTFYFARRMVILPLVPFRGLDLLDQAYLLFLEALMTKRNGLLFIRHVGHPHCDLV